ncbi:hypothetical protein BU23DRAFT_569049 [Bimuria novae-zelandiae CBS 107.79]|uniref:Uncharacterized protein n=1 Tax=Bimuria novae-zelandiae CBS 107.79 TaxID=1447943 RepID=A0A6A5V8B6_9PLEO|nr:hypothetical protein BU23DRAFT_569049 [Bimuria novae-zelandiae CBS 107.79]
MRSVLEGGGPHALRHVAAQLAHCVKDWSLPRAHQSQSILWDGGPPQEINTMFAGMYHDVYLTVDGAQAIYDHGFTDIEFRDHLGHTPLWFHASRIRIGGGTEFLDIDQMIFDLVQWFCDKGASIFAPHPVYGTLTGHLFADRFQTVFQYFGFGVDCDEIASEFFTNTTEYLQMLVDIFSDSNQDSCMCFCSSGSCDIATSAPNATHTIIDSTTR